MRILSKPLEWFYVMAVIARNLGSTALFKSETALMIEYDEMLSDEQIRELDEFKSSMV